MTKSDSIKLTALHINTENYRFEPIGSQKEAIDKMVVDQGDKLFNLAEHIVENGLNPNDKIQIAISNHDSTKYNVLEGNRRVVALKLLNNPDLIDGGKQSALRKKFKKLHVNNESKLLKEVECTIYDSPSEADEWIKLKHAGQSEGVGTVGWNAQQVQRFEEKVEGKSSISLQAIKKLEDSPDVPDDIKSGLTALKITNLDRMLSDPDIRTFLGIDISNGIIQSEVDETEVIRGLVHIVRDLLKTNFNVKKIYTKEDRKDYIKQFPKESQPNTDLKASKPWQFIDSSSPAVKSKSRLSRNPKDRETLIPKKCVLNIKNTKVNAIYHELQKLRITKYTNAAAVLYRVFVELSVDCYLEAHKLVKTPSAAKSGIDFQEKIQKVASHLENTKFADTKICKGIRTAVKDKNGLLGVDTWHAYVHNNQFSPTAYNLKITWDNMQRFMEILWENIKE
jgi:hypothetical protein